MGQNSGKCLQNRGNPRDNTAKRFQKTHHLFEWKKLKKKVKNASARPLAGLGGTMMLQQKALLLLFHEAREVCSIRLSRTCAKICAVPPILQPNNERLSALQNRLAASTRLTRCCHSKREMAEWVNLLQSIDLLGGCVDIEAQPPPPFCISETQARRRQ